MAFSQICDQKKSEFCTQRKTLCRIGRLKTYDLRKKFTFDILLSFYVVSAQPFESCVQKNRVSCTQIEKSLPIPTENY
jgi:hypothetical protein